MPGIYFAGNFLSHKTSTRSMGEELAARLDREKYFVVTASSHSNRFIRMSDFIWTAWRFRKRYQTASLEVYSGLAFRWVEILCAFLKWIDKPFILTLHGGKLPEFAKDNFHRVYKILISAKLVTTPSRYIKTAFTSIRPDIQYLPNGIVLDDYPYLLRNEVSPNLVWLRAFHEIYHPELAAMVLDLIAKEFPKAKLTMIGPDNHDGSIDQFQQLVQEKGLQDKIQILGGIPKQDVGSYISQGDIFLNTTNYESFGVSVLEAAACGLCIVTTNVGELPLLWDDGVDALLVPPNDPEAMAAAVRRILTEPGLAGRLSMNARRKAEQFDWSNILPKWEGLFRAS